MIRCKALFDQHTARALTHVICRHAVQSYASTHAGRPCRRAAALQAAVRQAMAGLGAALVAQAEAQATYTRNQTLVGTVARTVPEQSKRTLASATRKVAQMQALFDAAQIRLADYTIRAPIAGTVLSLKVDPGASVNASTLLMTVADLSRLGVRTDMDEAYVTQMQRGQPAVLRLTGEAALRDGHVSAVSQQVGEDTGGLATTLVFDVSVTAPSVLQLPPTSLSTFAARRSPFPEPPSSTMQPCPAF